MTKTADAPATSPLSSETCIPAAALCCLLVFLAPVPQAEAFDVRKCIYSTEKAAMYRNSDGRISCVNLGSVDELVQRGWGSHNPYDPVVVEITHFFGGNARPYIVDPIFNQEITRDHYELFQKFCVKFHSYVCDMQLNNGTMQQYLFSTEIKKYFTVNWDR